MTYSMRNLRHLHLGSIDLLDPKSGLHARNWPIEALSMTGVSHTHLNLRPLIAWPRHLRHFSLGTTLCSQGSQPGHSLHASPHELTCYLRTHCDTLETLSVAYDDPFQARDSLNPDHSTSLTDKSLIGPLHDFTTLECLTLPITYIALFTLPPPLQRAIPHIHAIENTSLEPRDSNFNRPRFDSSQTPIASRLPPNLLEMTLDISNKAFDRTVSTVPSYNEITSPAVAELISWLRDIAEQKPLRYPCLKRVVLERYVQQTKEREMMKRAVGASIRGEEMMRAFVENGVEFGLVQGH